MITALEISGFDIVPHLSLTFQHGMYAITGETGSGKSVLIGALQSLRDSSKRPGNVLDTATKAFVEAHFEIEKERVPAFLQSELSWQDNREEHIQPQLTCIIRREFSASGRSRVFLNDSPSTAEVVADLCSLLFDIHGQHDTQTLVRADEQLRVVDLFVDEALKTAYSREYKQLLEEKKTLDSLLERRTLVARDREFKEFQLAEIEKVQPQEGELEELEAEIRKSESIERIQTALHASIDHVQDSDSSALYHVSETLKHIGVLQQYYPELESTKEELTSVNVILQEASRTFMSIDVESLSEQELEESRGRFVELRALYKKYGGEQATLELYQELKAEILDSSSIDEQIQATEEHFRKHRDSCLRVAEQLHIQRQQCAVDLSADVSATLSELGMPNATFTVNVEMRTATQHDISVESKNNTVALTPTGCSFASFLFAPSKAATPMTLKSAASGGEISRIMLAIKAKEASSHAVPLMIFDEIDTGISGKVAAQTGRVLRHVATQNQLLVITHLPQIAAAAHRSISVEKQDLDNGSFAISACELARKDRIYEIAKLMSAEHVTEETLESAQQLTEQYVEQ